MTTEPDSANVTNQSGGVSIDAEQVNAGDMVARDKIVNVTNYAPANSASTSQLARVFPTNVRRRFESGMLVVEFTLTAPHTIKYQFDWKLFHRTIHLYLDGKEIFQDTYSTFHLYMTVDCPFRVEDVNCLFRSRSNFFTTSCKITIGDQAI